MEAELNLAVAKALSFRLEQLGASVTSPGKRTAISP